MISIIAAMGCNHVIGNDGRLLWHLPSDLKRFRELTIGHPVIMGRKTFESIIARNGKPLPGRTNIVLTSNPAFAIRKESGDPMLYDCRFVQSFHEALAQAYGSDETFVIGGAEVYTLALPYAHRMYLSIVDGSWDGDAFFPYFEGTDWIPAYAERVTSDPVHYVYRILDRVA